jgi:hypothetical protein
MFVLRYLALAAIAASSVDAFVAPGALPMQRTRVVAQSGLSRVRCQEQEAPKIVTEDIVKPVATGGTDYSRVPKKEVRVSPRVHYTVDFGFRQFSWKNLHACST